MCSTLGSYTNAWWILFLFCDVRCTWKLERRCQCTKHSYKPNRRDQPTHNRSQSRNNHCHEIKVNSRRHYMEGTWYLPAVVKIRLTRNKYPLNAWIRDFCQLHLTLSAKHLLFPKQITCDMSRDLLTLSTDLHLNRCTICEMFNQVVGSCNLLPVVGDVGEQNLESVRVESNFTPNYYYNQNYRSALYPPLPFDKLRI
jgi:hypothetical protein